MDQHNFQPGPPAPNSMATASFVLGIVGVATFCCIYTSVICGALAIIFAILSKRGSTVMSSRAKIGLILGIIGVALGAVILILYLVFIAFGSYYSYWDSIYDNSFYDYNFLLRVLKSF